MGEVAKRHNIDADLGSGDRRWYTSEPVVHDPSYPLNRGRRSPIKRKSVDHGIGKEAANTLTHAC